MLTQRLVRTAITLMLLGTLVITSLFLLVIAKESETAVNIGNKPLTSLAQHLGTGGKAVGCLALILGMAGFSQTLFEYWKTMNRIENFDSYTETIPKALRVLEMEKEVGENRFK